MDVKDYIKQFEIDGFAFDFQSGAEFEKFDGNINNGAVYVSLNRFVGGYRPENNDMLLLDIEMTVFLVVRGDINDVVEYIKFLRTKLFRYNEIFTNWGEISISEIEDGLMLATIELTGLMEW